MKLAIEIVGLTLALVLFGTACRCETTTFSGGPAPPIAKTGPESWNIDGKKYRVAATYYLALPEGTQYTIEYEVADAKQLEGVTDAKAYDMAFPLMRYALEHGSYKRVAINELGQGSREVSRIGVALFTRSGLSTQGYRVARSLADIKGRIGSSGAQ